MTAKQKETVATNPAPHYSKAPILEAILRIRTAGPIAASAVAAIHPLLAESYPTMQQLFEPLDEEGEDGSLTTTSTFVGYHFMSADRKHTVEARTDGLTVSRLRPYDSWESFSAEAKRVWAIYRTINGSPVGKIAVRYINRLEIPSPVTDLRNYLRTLPEIAPELPHTIKSFLLRLELPATQDTDIIVLQGTVKTSKPDVAALMLDIELKCSVENYTDEHIWSRFDELRAQKNDTFEHCITDSVRELIR